MDQDVNSARHTPANSRNDGFASSHKLSKRESSTSDLTDDSDMNRELSQCISCNVNG